ncbi:hypothetical protein Tco_0545216 [Tanacetum coccineum]
MFCDGSSCQVDQRRIVYKWIRGRIASFLPVSYALFLSSIWKVWHHRIPLTKFFVSVLKYFRIHISQLSPFGAARISHFEVLTRVLDLGPSVAVFRAFYTRMYSDGLFSFAKRSLSAPSCLSKPPDSVKNWADHFFWVDSRVFPISVPLYTGGVLEKDPAPHLTARQEQAVQVLSSNKAPFRRYPECFLALVGLSPYYPFGENTYPAFEGPDRTANGLLDYIRDRLTPEGARRIAVVGLSGAGAEVSAPVRWMGMLLKRSHSGGYSSWINRSGCDVAYGCRKDDQKQRKKAKRNTSVLKSSERSYLFLVRPALAKRLSRGHDAAVVFVPTLGRVGRLSRSQARMTSRKRSARDRSMRTAALNSEEPSVGYCGQILSGSEVRSRTEHELELKEKLRYVWMLAGDGVRESCLRNQVSVLAADKSSLSAEVSALKSDISQKDTVISLLGFSLSWPPQVSLDDSQLPCNTMEVNSGTGSGVVYISLWADLEAHVMDVSGRPLEGEFLPCLLTALAGRRWLLDTGGWIAMIKCLKSPDYQGILGHALGRAVDYGMQEGLAAGHEHGVAGTSLSAVMAYNPETAEGDYLDAVRALEEADFPLDLWKNLPEVARLQPFFAWSSFQSPIYSFPMYMLIVGETSLSFALLNVHNRAEGARKHAAALRRLMVDIVFSSFVPLQNLLGEASTSAVAFCVEDLDTDEDLGSVVCMPHLEESRFEVFRR